MKPRFAILIWLLAASPLWAQTKVLVVPPAGIEATRIGAQRGVDPVFGSGTQESRLTAALTATDKFYGPTIPGGDWEITGTVVLPAKWGAAFRGTGGTANDIGDSHFANNLQGSKQCSRLIWKGADGGTMVRADGGGFDIANINFEGCRVAGSGPEPTGDVYPNRAAVGLHINTSSNGAVAGAKCVLHNLSFRQIGTHILIGRNLTGVGDGDYTGDDDSHADTVYISQTQHWFPSTGVHAGLGSAIHIRNDQSLGNYFGNISCHGRPAQVVYIERGGKTHIGQILHSGSSGYALRLGWIDANQGSISVDRIAVDAVGGQCLKGDTTNYNQITSNCVSIGAMDIPPAVTTVPQVDVGPGKWLIQNAAYLQEGAIKLTGISTGGSDRMCHIHLENCVLYDTNLEDVVDAASSGPYLLTWRNCSRYHQGGSPLDWGIPFEDSTELTEITNGGVARIAPDFEP